MLEEQGDFHGGLHLGTGGAQADAAYAVTDLAAVRGGIQVAGYAGDGHYVVGTLGAGVYGTDASAFRWGVAVTGGAGPSRGVTTLAISTGSDTQDVTFVNSGIVAIYAVRPELAFEAEGFGVGATFGTSYHQMFHDASSDGTGVGHAVLVEPVGVVRAGPPPVGLEVFAGIAWPLWTTGDVGLPNPLVLGIGITFDGLEP